MLSIVDIKFSISKLERSRKGFNNITIIAGAKKMVKNAIVI